jgi:hypothetical protein
VMGDSQMQSVQSYCGYADTEFLWRSLKRLYVRSFPAKHAKYTMLM